MEQPLPPLFLAHKPCITPLFKPLFNSPILFLFNCMHPCSKPSYIYPSILLTSSHATFDPRKAVARSRQTTHRFSQDPDLNSFRAKSVKMVLAVDLLNPAPAAEAKKHKLKTLVPAPRSFFMDVKCPGCFTITTVFSHAQTVVICQGCTTVLCQPTGGKARLTEGCSFRRK